MKKILIISSNKTGHGHKSIGESLVEQLNLSPDVSVEVVEGFLLFGRLGLKAGELYGPITRLGSDFWKLAWDISISSPKAMTQLLAPLLHDRFMQRLKDDPPGLILSIHPVFNSTILDALKQHSIHIPFMTLLADLVDIHPLWVDSRASAILCPTAESLNASIMLGAPRSILKQCSFPTRGQFVDAARLVERQPYVNDRPLECLLMSGGEGSGNLKKISKLLLSNFNCRVTVICGRNVRLQKSLQNHLEDYGDRVNVLGFCENVQDYMLQADIAIMRGSPNSMLEAVVCNTPLIITGSLAGQEARNPEFAEMHGVGVVCRSLKKLPLLLKGLIDNDAEGLNAIAQKQREFRNFESASDIADILIEHTLDMPPIIPDFEPLFPGLLQAAELYRKLESLNKKQQ